MLVFRLVMLFPPNKKATLDWVASDFLKLVVLTNYFVKRRPAPPSMPDFGLMRLRIPRLHLAIAQRDFRGRI
jgi:hypothetical protein